MAFVILAVGNKNIVIVSGVIIMFILISIVVVVS